MLKVDIVTPKDVQLKYKDLNFPFIFGNVNVEPDMLTEKMLADAKLRNRKFPYACKSLKFNANEVVLTTPLLKFYLSYGLVITKVHWAMQFLPDQKPFCKFIDEMVKIRINAVGNNKPLGGRAKFTMNSCIGRVMINLYHFLNLTKNCIQIH